MEWRGRGFSLVSFVLFLGALPFFGLEFRPFNRYGPGPAVFLGPLFALLLLGVVFWAGRQYDKAVYLARLQSGTSKLRKELKEKESCLKDCRDRMDRMLDSMRDAVFIYGSGKILYGNAAAAEWLNLEQLKNMPFEKLLTLVHPGDYESITRYIGTGSLPWTEFRLLYPDGLYREAEVCASAIRYEEQDAFQVIVRDLSGVKQSSRKLLEAQRELQEVLRHQPGITFKFRKEEGGFVHTLWEGELARTLGLYPSMAIGYSPDKLLPVEQAEQLTARYASAWEEQRPVEFETMLLGVPCLVALKPVLRGDEVKEVVGYCTDLTLRKRDEEELLRTKEVLESLFGNTSDAISLADLSGRIVQTNPAFERMFGWSPEEFLGKELSTIVPEDRMRESEWLRQSVRSGDSVSAFETKRLHKDGHTFDASITLSPIRNNSGSIVAIAAITRDISEAKRMYAALLDSESKHRLIAENMSDVIAVMNTDGGLEYISPSCRTILGEEPERVASVPLFDWLHPGDREKAKGLLYRLMRAGHSETMELRFRHAQGQWVAMEALARRIPYFGKGLAPCILVVARDISERKNAEDMLRRSEKLSVVGQLAAGVAHEIRNPLTSLKGFLQLLRKRSADHANYFDLMLSELDRINTIVSEFLVLSKPQTARFRRETPARIVREVVSFLESQAHMNGVEIVTDLREGEELEVFGDENQLKQVFINLLKNAVEAMPKGGLVQVSILLLQPDRLTVRFQDQGPGIPEEMLRKLGEPFYTTKEKGTGLGLMVSFRIIEEHGGTVSVSSRLQEGTVFDVELPVMKE